LEALDLLDTERTSAPPVTAELWANTCLDDLLEPVGDPEGAHVVDLANIAYHAASLYFLSKALSQN
jgi:hypothetical protein